MIVMEKVMEVVSLLNGEDKKKILELANILLKQNKYNKLRKDIEARRDEIKRGEILSHEKVWQNRDI
jgi:sialic acid synthase SpsE